MKNKDLIRQNNTGITVAKIATFQKSNMQKMHISVVSKMETTTPRQVIVSNTRFINWYVQKMHIPTVSILETVQAKKSH